MGVLYISSWLYLAGRKTRRLARQTAVCVEACRMQSLTLEKPARAENPQTRRLAHPFEAQSAAAFNRRGEAESTHIYNRELSNNFNPRRQAVSKSTVLVLSRRLSNR